MTLFKLEYSIEDLGKDSLIQILSLTTTQFRAIIRNQNF